MKKRYLSIDVGTSGVKAAIVDENLKIILINKISYDLITFNFDFVELDFENVLKCLIDCIKFFGNVLRDVEGIGLSVLCPGLVPIDRAGNPLRNAIIHLDRRSKKQSLSALNAIGEEKFLSLNGNLPYPGGISLSSILWIKENEDSVYRKTFKFGHTNTFLVKKITGNFGIDPTNASFTGLYNTIDLSGWSSEIIDTLKIEKSLLPLILPSHGIAGHVNKEFSMITGIKTGVPVIMGAGDTSCAALGAGLTANGNILNTTGTVEAIVLVLDKPYADKKLLLRTHALEGKWLSMYIIGAGGIAIEWARKQFYRDLERSYFYDKYLPGMLANHDLKMQVRFRPYLCGDRLSMSQKKGSLSNLSLDSTRDDILVSIVLGLIRPLQGALKKFKKIINISDTIYCTGQGSSFLSDIKKKIFSTYYLKTIDPNSALIGAAKLLLMGVEGLK